MSVPPLIYLNENIPVSVVTLLAERGIRSLSTRDANNLGIGDEAQLVYATEHQCIVLTYNRRHFRYLHQKWLAEGKKHCGIIVVRPSDPKRLADRIKLFFERVYPSVDVPFCLSPPRLD